MGLDIYFLKSKKEKEEIGYFRKVNCLVAWVDNNVDTVENCRDVILEKEHLEKLLEDTTKVLEDKSLANKLLPNQKGFFFGSERYDEDYFENLKYIKDTVEKILETVDFEKEEVSFYCWW